MTDSKQTTQAAAKAAKPAAVYVVHCHAKDGRRRGGTRWDHGKTEVPASKMTKKMLAALEADGLFSVMAPPEG
ncbi:hypothetical protein [Tropicimonas sp. S265A]|uniref:hypothetical protein n=1 Tax=Tropicimonas sp. S265A TaxID=3415134 RepID=UPI003C7A4B6A